MQGSGPDLGPESVTIGISARTAAKIKSQIHFLPFLAHVRDRCQFLKPHVEVEVVEVDAEAKAKFAEVEVEVVDVDVVAAQVKVDLTGVVCGSCTGVTNGG